MHVETYAKYATKCNGTALTDGMLSRNTLLVASVTLPLSGKHVFCFFTSIWYSIFSCMRKNWGQYSFFRQMCSFQLSLDYIDKYRQYQTKLPKRKNPQYIQRINVCNEIQRFLQKPKTWMAKATFGAHYSEVCGEGNRSTLSLPYYLVSESVPLLCSCCVPHTFLVKKAVVYTN